MPDYNPGDSKHLHALGVIAVVFANFQASLDNLYIQRARVARAPMELIKLYYFQLSEEKRITVLKKLFEEYEQDQFVKDAITNLCDYFQWCQHCRNNLLHAEPYPAILGSPKDILYLTKKISKGSDKAVYIRLTLLEARDIADKIRDGVKQCATLKIYLAFRKWDPAKIPARYQVYTSELPSILPLPPRLDLSLSP